MHETLELINFEERVPLSFSIVYFDYIARHMHNKIQVLIVLDGKLEIEIDGQTYKGKEDDIVIINPYSYHSLKSKNNATLLNLIIDQEGFGVDKHEVNNLYFDLNSMKMKTNPRYVDIAYLILSIVYFNTKENINSIYTNRAIAYSLFAQLMNDFRVDKKEVNIAKNYDNVALINDYMLKHYKENFTLETLSKQFNYSVSYLSRYFKQNFGKNFQEYYDVLRINYSLYELVNTNKPIETIANEIGFNSARSFVRAFKKIMNLYPSEYRLSGQTNRLQNVNIYDDNFKKNLLNKIIKKYDLLRMARSEKTESSRQTGIVLDTSLKKDYFENNYAFKKILSLNSAKSLLIFDVVKGIQEIQEKIGFEYIILDDLYNRDLNFINSNNEGEITLNYFFMYKILNFLNTINLKPIFRFTNKVMDNYNSFYYLPDFIKRLSNLYGEKYLNNIVFSLRIDTNLINSDLYEKDLILKTYLHFYRTIKNVNKNIKVTSLVFKKEEIERTNIFEDFLKLVENEKLEIEDYPILFKNDFNKTLKLEKNRAELKDFLSFLKNNNLFIKDKICLENINFTTNTNLLNDTLFQSSYLIKNYLDIFQDLYAFVKYSTFDFEYNLNKTNYLFYGGAGFYANSGIEKSSYYAYLFLNTLEHKILEYGENYLISKGNNRIVILLNNYNHYSNLFADNEYFELTYKSRYSCFPSSTKINLKINLTDIAFKKARLVTTYLSTNSGSSYDAWVQGGAPSYLKETEIETLKKLSEPKFKVESKDIKQGSLSVEANIAPLETQIIEIDLI